MDVSRRLCSKCETPVVNTALLSSLSTNSSDPFINETRRLQNVWYLRVRCLTSRFHCSFTQQLILQPMAGLKESQPSLPPRRRVTVLERYQNQKTPSHCLCFAFVCWKYSIYMPNVTEGLPSWGLRCFYWSPQRTNSNISLSRMGKVTVQWKKKKIIICLHISAIL